MITIILVHPTTVCENGLEFHDYIRSVVLRNALAGGKAAFSYCVAAIFLVSINSRYGRLGFGQLLGKKNVEVRHPCVAFQLTQIRTIINNFMIKRKSRKKLKESLAGQV